MIVIVDYGMGNHGSIVNMFRKINIETTVSADAAIIDSAEKLVLPGVGAFDAGMQHLRERGLIPVLTRRAITEKVPVLGICLGTQLMTRRSEEGREPGLGWLAADTVRFRFNGESAALKIPHMGWSRAAAAKPSALVGGLEPEARFYFVHSYHLVCDDPGDVLLTADYGHAFPAAVEHGNLFGVQFHPEKSHKLGMQLLRNFATL